MNDSLKKAFAEGQVQVFVGAGLSQEQYPSSDRFRDILLNAPIYIEGQETTLSEYLGPKPLSLEDVAEYYELYDRSDGLVRKIREVFGEKPRPDDLHQSLWSFPGVRIIYTTNFDCSIEDAIPSHRQQPIVLTSLKSIREIDPLRRIVFKPHGCARLSSYREEFVVTRDDYLKYATRRPLESLQTLYDLQKKVFLFLGYGLRDLHIRHILIEAERISGVESYAIMKDEKGPELRYWEKHGVCVIRMDIREFLADVFDEFPIDQSEWSVKGDLRVADKEEIANKAFRTLRQLAEQANDAQLDVFIDSGTTCLHFAKALLQGIRQRFVSSKRLRLVTNSPEVISACVSSMGSLKEDERVRIISLGGPLRHHTHAFTPDSLEAESQLSALKRSSGNRSIAFVGVSYITPDGLLTRTEAEVAIKKAFVECADEVFVLADHDKARWIEGGIVFSKLSNEKISIITDRVENMAIFQANVREII